MTPDNHTSEKELRETMRKLAEIRAVDPKRFAETTSTGNQLLNLEEARFISVVDTYATHAGRGGQAEVSHPG